MQLKPLPDRNFCDKKYPHTYEGLGQAYADQDIALSNDDFESWAKAELSIWYLERELEISRL